LIEKAWECGCRLDGWSEHFNFQAWSEAMDKTGIDCAVYSQKSFGKDELLPWDIIDVGVKKDLLYREYERALTQERSPGCRETCLHCGLRCAGKTGTPENTDTTNLMTPESGDPWTPERADAGINSARAKVRVRAQFTKMGRLRYLSHLELMTAVIRGLRRAGVRFDFSKGFHPAPRVSFGPSLGVGVAGEREYFDMEVFSPFAIESYMGEINRSMPEDLRIIKMGLIPVNGPSLNNFITRYAYTIKGVRVEDLSGATSGGSREISSVIVRRDGKEVDIAPCIEEVAIDKDIRLVLKDHDTVKVRIGEVIEALFGLNFRETDITRNALYGWENGWVEPL